MSVTTELLKAVWILQYMQPNQPLLHPRLSRPIPPMTLFGASLRETGPSGDVTYRPGFGTNS